MCMKDLIGVMKVFQSGFTLMVCTIWYIYFKHHQIVLLIWTKLKLFTNYLQEVLGEEGVDSGGLYTSRMRRLSWGPFLTLLTRGLLLAGENPPEHGLVEPQKGSGERVSLLWSAGDSPAPEGAKRKGQGEYRIAWAWVGNPRSFRRKILSQPEVRAGEVHAETEGTEKV